MSATLEALLALAATAAPAATAPTEANYHQQHARAKATQAQRIHKKAEHAKVLDSVGGDRESLKTICLWEPRTVADEMRFAALDRKLKSEIGNDDRAAMIDLLVGCETVEYKLIEVEVPRARHPDEEVAFAKLQGRFRETKPAIQGFFHKPSMKHGDRRHRRVHPAPLGDFDWCDRDENIAQVNAMTRAERLERSLRKIRNVKESL